MPTRSPTGRELRTFDTRVHVTGAAAGALNRYDHIANRIMQMAGGREVLVSSTVKDLAAGAGLAFDPAGTHALRGVDGTWTVYQAPSAG